MSRPRGRPRTFDRDHALRQAMHVFWHKGYEGTTMTDLTEAIGVKAPSLYAAFGDKHALFQEAVDFYARHVSALPLGELHGGRGIIEDMAAMLRASIRMYAGKSTLPGMPAGKGCMVVIAAINCAPENTHHSEALSQRRQKRRGEIRSRLLQAQKEGEIRSDADIGALADFYTSLLNGMALGARDGVSQARHAAMIASALLPLQSVLVAGSAARVGGGGLKQVVGRYK